MNISSLFQFVIGFFVGIIFFTAGIAGGAYFFLTNVSQNPEKHIFAEEKPSPKQEKEKQKETQSKATNNESKPASTQAVEKKPESIKEEELPSGAYFARVTWSTGLSLRAEPSIDAQKVGGIGYNSKLIVLSTSRDGNWQKVRLISNGQEAWVKAGNVAKIKNEE